MPGMEQSYYPIKIKICGIKTPDQAVEIAEAGADAIGLVMARSPRQVSVQKAMEITAAVPPFVQTIAVFVNPDEDQVKRALYDCGIDMIQLHGSESPDFCKKFSNRVVKAWRIRGKEDLFKLKEYENCVRGFLLDAWDPNQAGGTGKTFDWSLGQEAVKHLSKSVILAGGLRPENVQAAVKQVRPWGVDASSSLEKAPGIKDLAKVKSFIEAVKSVSG